MKKRRPAAARPEPAPTLDTSGAHEAFTPPVREWFEATFTAATRVQALGWPAIAGGAHTLLLAPTGSGKTLAAFLASLDALIQLDPDAAPGVRVLYVSPLKALVYDIERNLRAPLVGIANAAARQGRTIRPLRVDVRTGDTPARDRRQQLRHPADILVTTPESLYLLLGSEARETLRSVHTLIVDEIHVMAASKRGVHLALSVERLCLLTDREPQRVGLSATQRPLEEIARYLGGDRPVQIIDASERPDLDLQIVVPVADMERPTVRGGIGGSGGEGPFQRVGAGKPTDDAGDRMSTGLWPAIYPCLLELIRTHRSTILFTNSRLLCERLAQRLNELAGEDIVLAHHGSLSHERRALIEEALKAGRLPALVATSSLELGIDMGAVDLVILVESPGSVASGLQRVGRAGHSVGERSIGRIFPKFRGDLLEVTAVAAAMAEAAVEPTRVPKNCLDVLAQQVVAMVSDRAFTVGELAATVRRTWSYRDLTDGLLASVLDMVSGRFPTDELADLKPRLVWDRATDTLTARKGTRMIALLNGGTIPDRGLYGVFLGAEGKRIGELDEEMVYESRRGDLIILGASTWRIDEITRDRVVVAPAPGEPGRLPFWHGERPGRTAELGRRVGALTREVASRGDRAEAWLREVAPLDAYAASNLVAYVREQEAATGQVPTDRTVVVESFRDELGDWRVCVLTPFGSRVHAPWGLALEQLLVGRGGHDVQVLWTDDGLSLRFADTDEEPDTDPLWIDPEEVEALVVEQLGRSALFAARFRENAARSLLTPKRTAKGRTPLWAQRLRSQNLLTVAARFPDFPIVLETYRECLQDTLDVPSLVALLTQIRARDVRVHTVVTASASPFARSLAFAWAAAFMYAGDAPTAERRAMALSLDRSLLRELLGQEELRELLDPGAVAEVEAELRGLAAERRVRGPDALHDLLRRLGDLGQEEIGSRCEGDGSAWIAELLAARRAVAIRIAGRAAFIAVEDAARYRDALGVALPPGLPAVFLEPFPDPVASLLLRYARTHGPFTASAIGLRLGLAEGVARAVLIGLLEQDRLVHGEIRPGGLEPEFCDPDVLRRLKRRSLAALRQQIAPVEAPVYARFLVRWHGIGSDRSGLARLREVVAQLEGLPILASQLESEVLPRRVRGFESDLLDTLGAMGEVVWVGRGAAGPRDGHVALVRRDRVALLLEPPAAAEDPRPLHDGLLAHLRDRGASFLVGLQAAVASPTDDLVAALWDLVWEGRITNDTFQPLRSLRARRSGHGRQQPGRRGTGAGAGGRWSLVDDLFGGALPSDTERAVARTAMLLERHGVVCGASARAEAVPGGYSAVYPVLQGLEDSGRARRGWFVEGLDGSQFAGPGAVDRLRACRDEEEDAYTVLGATDPASPWGSVLSWPSRGDEGPTPRRAVGASVVSRGGRPVLYVERGERSIVTLPTPDGVSTWVAALRAWLESPRDRWRSVRVERIDGEPAAAHAMASGLAPLGFVPDGGTLEWVRGRLRASRSD